MTVNAFMRILMVCSLFCSICPPAAKARPQPIKVVMDNNYPPFSFKDSAGKQQGILIDQWRLWEQEVLERFNGLELNGFILKPFNLEKLSDELQRILERNDYVAQN